MTDWDEDDIGWNSATYAIVCRRGGGSVFGAATAYAKDREGKTLIFETENEAIEQARVWTKGMSSPNLSYTVERYGWRTK